MMAMQGSGVVFAGETGKNYSCNVVSENSKIKVYEDSNVRICSGLENYGYVVSTFDKKTKKMEQKISDPKTGALISLTTFDFSKKYNANSDASKDLSDTSRHTLFGYKYWTDTDPKVNMIYCEIHGGANKGVFLDMGTKEQIDAAYNYANKVEDIGNAELATEITLIADAVLTLYFGTGALVKILTTETVMALGFKGSVVEDILKYHKLLLEAEAAFEKI